MMGNCINNAIIVRGAGDISTGVVQKLYRAGFKILVLDLEKPLTIRRTVALSTAITNGVYTVEDMTGVLIKNVSQCEEIWAQNKIPVLIDKNCESAKILKPDILVDCIIAKKNLGTNKNLAPITIALGPGFEAPCDVDAVIETMRGHSLGKVIFDGKALPNTNTPGILGGETFKRVVHAPYEGHIRHLKEIGQRASLGETLFYVDDKEVKSPLDGTLRGLIENKMYVKAGLKIADVDPRPENEVDCFTISDKARALGGAVLETVLYLKRIKNI